ncbi:MAG TPA: flavodoxin [Candidatus Limnocylindrales bacterium]|nr:flavodoxin [Candidatus Limnocylindrales bacterium]
MKSLVVFYTRNGNARFVAQTVAAEIGADIEEVIDLKKRSGILGFVRGGRDAQRGKGTEIAPTQKSPADYELIIVGTPIWAGRPTPAITTYLRNNSLSGKKVAVFFVQGGKRTQGIEQIKALIPDSTYLGEISIVSALKNKEETEKQITEWCKTLTTASQ